jgi:hypothetical protein
LSFAITFDCPTSSAAVPAVFSCSGTFDAGTESAVVKCNLSYNDASGTAQAPCKVCVLGSGTWCCRFDISGALPGATNLLMLNATLYDSNNQPLAGPAGSDATYSSSATDPCTCSGAGSSC